MVRDYGNNKGVMQVIAISKFKATCLSLLEKVKNTGQPLVVTKKGKAIALISPPPVSSKKGVFGCMKGTARIVGDIVSPLPEEDWEVLRN